MNASTVDQVMSSDQSEDDVALLGNGRPDANQMSDFETEELVSEPLADSNTALETLTFGDDFEPTPMRADLSETSSLSDLLATDFSLYEPTPIRTAAPPPQPQAPNRTIIDNQGFPVIRPDTSIPSMGLLSSEPQQQPPSFPWFRIIISNFRKRYFSCVKFSKCNNGINNNSNNWLE
ncbi:hypothetical protein MHU86_13888 [Fragilaria crotonensis]|nr:hypothetical protein MHU86_13888 [Fragilaria crotonensis]